MFLLLLAPAAVLLVLLAEADNRWVEFFFLPYVYRPLSFVIGSLCSLFPFSVTEVLAVLAAAGALVWSGFFIAGLIRGKKDRKHRLYRAFINVLCILSCALFLFEIEMGLNYYRFRAAYYLGLDVHESSTDELYELTRALADDINENRALLAEDGGGVALLSDGGRYETSAAARDAYKKLSERYPFLKAADIRNKPLLSSRLFSAALTTGIYIPFTFESNINVDVPEYTIPATMCHELTHFRGFMREEEANFLGYLACAGSDRADFRYSAAMMAFSYCYPRLRSADKERAVEIARTLCGGALRDIAAEDEYWEPFRNTAVSEATGKVYEGYLRANDQKSGLASYGEMVDLLLAYQRKNGGK